MGLRDRIEGEAMRLGATARGAAASGALQLAGGSFRGLRAMFSDSNEQPATVERFLIALVRAVRDDERVADRSTRDVFELARRRRRRLALASFGAGPLIVVANQLSDLYCETATVCDLADVHGFELSDGQIAAHMLVLWSLADTPDEAQAMIAGTGERSVAGILASRMGERTQAYLPGKLTKRSAIKGLWDARGVVGDATKGNSSGAVGNVMFAGHRMKQLIKQAERQLGVR